MEQRMKDLDIHLDGKKLRQRQLCIPGWNNGDGKDGGRITAGTNAWRIAEGVIGDTRISRRCKGKVLTSCVTPAYVYGLETMALTEIQQRMCRFAKTSG